MHLQKDSCNCEVHFCEAKSKPCCDSRQALAHSTCLKNDQNDMYLLHRSRVATMHTFKKVRCWILSPPKIGIVHKKSQNKNESKHCAVHDPVRWSSCPPGSRVSPPLAMRLARAFAAGHLLRRQRMRLEARDPRPRRDAWTKLRGECKYIYQGIVEIAETFFVSRVVA